MLDASGMSTKRPTTSAGRTGSTVTRGTPPVCDKADTHAIMILEQGGGSLAAVCGDGAVIDQCRLTRSRACARKRSRAMGARLPLAGDSSSLNASSPLT